MSTADLTTRFLEQHPEYLDDVRYYWLPGSDEPTLCLRTPAMLALIAWSFAHGYVHDVAAARAYRAAVLRASQGDPSPGIRVCYGRRDPPAAT